MKKLIARRTKVHFPQMSVLTLFAVFHSSWTWTWKKRQKKARRQQDIKTKMKRKKSACSVSLPIGGSKGLGTQNRKRQTDEKIKTQREDKYSLQYFTCLCFTETRGGAGVSIFSKNYFFSKTQYSRLEFFIGMKM